MSLVAPTFTPTLTPEQVDILAHDPAPGDTIVINAYAGTGKTTTCMKIVEKYSPTKRFLYIVFNKNMQVEATARAKKAQFQNFTCKTTHSLALEFCKSVFTPFQFSTSVAVEHGQLGWLSILRKFWSGSFHTLQKMYDYYDRKREEQKAAGIEFDPEKDDFITTDKNLRALATQIWQDMIQERRPFTFDAYLKYFCMHKQAVEWLSASYDVVLLDEAQDTNRPLADMLMKPHPAMAYYFIGDVNQSIYGFRNCVDIMSLAISTHSFSLTRSFRFGPDLGQYATHLLKTLKGEVLVRKCGGPVVGSAPHPTKISMGYTDDWILPPIPQLARGEFAFISRTNAVAFQYAAKAAECGYMVAFTNGKECVAAMKKMVAEYSTCSDAQLRHMLEVATQKDDFETIRHIQLYQSMDPESLKRKIQTVESKYAKTPQEAHVILSTCHGAKGLEFDHVLLAEDLFGPKKTKPKTKKNNQDSEEPDPQLDFVVGTKKTNDFANLLYVAVTRAKKWLLMPIVAMQFGDEFDNVPLSNVTKRDIPPYRTEIDNGRSKKQRNREDHQKPSLLPPSKKKRVVEQAKLNFVKASEIPRMELNPIQKSEMTKFPGIPDSFFE